MEIYDVVKKLIGEIEPVGETTEDDKRFENLKVIIKLVDALLIDIDDVASYKSRHEYSLKRAGKFASKFQDEIRIIE